MFRKKEEKSLLQWTIEEDGKYQSKLIDIIAERNNRINKAIEYIEHNRWCDITDFDDNYKEIVINADKVIEILKGEDNES